MKQASASSGLELDRAVAWAWQGFKQYADNATYVAEVVPLISAHRTACNATVDQARNYSTDSKGIDMMMMYRTLVHLIRARDSASMLPARKQNLNVHRSLYIHIQHVFTQNLSGIVRAAFNLAALLSVGINHENQAIPFPSTWPAPGMRHLMMQLHAASACAAEKSYVHIETHIYRKSTLSNYDIALAIWLRTKPADLPSIERFVSQNKSAQSLITCVCMPGLW